jgi:hypothetical protein
LGDTTVRYAGIRKCPFLLSLHSSTSKAPWISPILATVTWTCSKTLTSTPSCTKMVELMGANSTSTPPPSSMVTRLVQSDHSARLTKAHLNFSAFSSIPPGVRADHTTSASCSLFMRKESKVHTIIRRAIVRLSQKFPLHTHLSFLCDWIWVQGRFVLMFMLDCRNERI